MHLPVSAAVSRQPRQVRTAAGAVPLISCSRYLTTGTDSGRIQKMRPFVRPPRGFTLIEIMVVMVIIAILGALIGPQILSRVDEARVTKAQADIRTLGTALDLYRMDNFKYPTTDQGLDALVRKPADPSLRNWKAGGYVQKLSKDPWGNDYRYISPGTRGGAYDLYSLGADGEPGGEGTDADIGNWNDD